MRAYVFATVALAHTLWTRMRARLSEQPGDAGYTTETVIITALLVLMAITVIAILSSKVVNLAKGINLTP